MAAKARADWDAIEPHYRAGIRALKDIAQEFGISDAAIVKHAKKKSWDRNLKAKIQAKADAKVSAAMVSAEVSALTKVTEAVRIEVEAEVQARIRLAHRTDISRARKLVMTLLEELETQTGDAAALKRLGELMEAPDERGVDKLSELYHKVISLGSRTGTMKQLADSLKTLVSMEREAFGINAGEEEKPLRDLPQDVLDREVGKLLAKAGITDAAGVALTR